MKVKFIMFLKEYSLPVLLPLLILWSINAFVLQYGIIPSPSMAPTADEGTFIFGNRLAYLHEHPQHGDIVIFKDEDKKLLIKRVIGIPGDTLFFKDGEVYLNDELLTEDYLLAQGSTYSLTSEFTVAAGEYFLMGDNRKGSNDSRRWEVTTIPEDQISSKAFYVIPFRECRTKAGKI